MAIPTPAPQHAIAGPAAAPSSRAEQATTWTGRPPIITCRAALATDALRMRRSVAWNHHSWVQSLRLPFMSTSRRWERRVRSSRPVQCRFQLDHEMIDAGCRNDRALTILTWRETPETALNWGGCQYKVLPRKKTPATITGGWYGGDIQLSGRSPLAGDGSVLRGLAAARAVPVAAGRRRPIHHQVAPAMDAALHTSAASSASSHRAGPRRRVSR